MNLFPRQVAVFLIFTILTITRFSFSGVFESKYAKESGSIEKNKKRRRRKRPFLKTANLKENNDLSIFLDIKLQPINKVKANDGCDNTSQCNEPPIKKKRVLISKNKQKYCVSKHLDHHSSYPKIKPCKQVKEASFQQRRQYEGISSKHKMISLESQIFHGETSKSGLLDRDILEDEMLHGYYKYIPTVTFDMEPVYNRNREDNVPVVPQDIPGYLVPLCSCIDCDVTAKRDLGKNYNAKGEELRECDKNIQNTSKNISEDAYYEPCEDEEMISNMINNDIVHDNYRPLGDIIKSLSISDFDVYKPKAHQNTFSDEKKNSLLSQITREVSLGLLSRNNETTKLPELTMPTTKIAFRKIGDNVQYILPPTRKNIFDNEEYDGASLAVPQPTILKHSTDPYHPFVCFEEENHDNSMAARTLIETSELKRIVPPKSLDDIVPTTLVSTCSTLITTEKVLTRCVPKHLNMLNNKWSKVDFLKQNNYVQELHTIYGDTSDKLYKAM